MNDLLLLRKLSELTMEELYGGKLIVVSENGKPIKTNEIQSINISGADITEIPGIIWHIHSLKILNISETNITAIPESIGNLRGLQVLNASGTRITKLPQRLRELSSLRSLKVSDTRIKYFPSGIIKSLPNLQSIDFSGTDITSLPDKMGEILHDLLYLYLSRTKISSLPDSIGDIQSLQSLDLSETHISVLPDNIWNLHCLKILNVSGTNLVELSDKISGFYYLHYLNISRTNITELPKKLETLLMLKSIDASETNITMLPKSIRSLEKLRFLNLSRTHISDLTDSVTFLRCLESLNVSGTNLTSLPNGMRFLYNLKNLDVSRTPLKTLMDTNREGELPKLTEINASETSLSTLPKSIGNLNNLERLNVSNTQLIILPKELCRLQKLKKLDVSFSQITTLPDNIGDLESLEDLDVGWTLLSVLPNSIGDLYNLKNLDLSFTNLTTLPETIEFLYSLKYLNISGNDTISLPNSFNNLKSLSHLNISGTKIKPKDNIKGGIKSSDLSALSGLLSLTHLDLSETEISNLDALSDLPQLESLNLQNSKTSAIPECILALKLNFVTKESKNGEWLSHPGIYIYNLILTDQPIEIYYQSDVLISAYNKDKDQVPVKECKVIFLGDADSGKTYSIRRLLKKGKYLKNYKEPSTPGIEIEVSSIKDDKVDIIVNYWDFGGQDIQQPMHRMFLTNRTAYVVFLNARQDELIDERAIYWLENIKTFAPDAPVLIVVNKIDQNPNPNFNSKRIMSAYSKQVKKVVWMSAKEDNPSIFLEKLLGSIRYIIRDYLNVNQLIPSSWKSLMDDIRIMTDYYLTAEQFQEKCILHKISNYKEIHKDLAELFLTVGVSFCYYKNRALSDYILLNPKWMVNALYIIVTNGKLVSRNGVITQNDLYDLLGEDYINGIKIKRVLPKVRYTNSQANYIIGVIRMFGISYQLDDGSELLPMLSGADEKVSVDDFVPYNALHFLFRYEFLPINVVHRLIVKMQKDIDHDNIWYTGAIFKNTAQRQIAYIHSLKNDLHIYVFEDDQYYNPNEYLTPISNIVRHINSDMGLLAKEYLIYQKNGKKTEILYEEVKGSLQNNIYQRYDASINELIDLKELAHRYNPDRPKLSPLLSAIIGALETMQNNMTYYRNAVNSKNLENIRTRFVADQLKAAGFICSEQQYGGISGTGKSFGIRDMVVKDNHGCDVLIYEAQILTGLDKNIINDHLGRVLINYNPLGLRKGVLATYLECDRGQFKSLTDKYREYISVYAPKPYYCIGSPKKYSTYGQFIVCLEMNYGIDNSYYTIYHMIVRIAP